MDDESDDSSKSMSTLYDVYLRYQYDSETQEMEGDIGERRYHEIPISSDFQLAFGRMQWCPFSDHSQET